MKTLLSLLLSLLSALFSGLSLAQAYPSKPVRLIIPFPPGGSNDVVGRAIGQQLAERLGQGVVIDNRGGAGSVIGTNEAAKAPPDGYALLLISTAFPTSIAFNRLPQDALKSFAPVAMLGSGPALLVVPANSPANSVADLLNALKAKPGELNAAAAGIGSFQHMATELFRLQSKTSFVIVQYKGGGPALTDTIGGQVQFNLGSLVQMVPHVRSGKLKALGVSSAKRVAAMPEVPTIAEAGVAGYEVSNWWGLLAPAGTPAPVLDRLYKEIIAILDSPETRKRFELEGAEVMRMSPAEFANFVSQETVKWTKVVKEAGIKPE
ncbi:MAG TPA: tripartite tricarboxylate transporter substrate binding protein [Burkholderiales bacterium]|jgi:tripartite-type tricarboxylate transporter receptor subunit TctC|nr:tripartite tricarboxylate transporter substrate binding protein [Burkholderiales bacterium]